MSYQRVQKSFNDHGRIEINKLAQDFFAADVEVDEFGDIFIGSVENREIWATDKQKSDFADFVEAKS